MSHNLSEELSRLIEQVITLLDAVNRLPFHNEWLSRSPGLDYVQFLRQAETFLLWSWEAMNQGSSEQLSSKIRCWDGEESRQEGGLLRRYYQFYEALGNWGQSQSNPVFRGEGQWQDFIFETVFTENHLLKRMTASPQKASLKELELVAQEYLELMQKIGRGDLYLICLDVFTFIGAFTQKRYFIPQLGFSLESVDPATPLLITKQQFQDAAEWTMLASDYLEYLGR